nr:K(+)-transporting ATPase subunit F [Motilibacter deserti]
MRCPRPGGRAAVSAENVVGLVLAVGLLGYLVVALLFPERL